ncbi:hypothetical protein D779_2105 [Imhoffiella purpurea]|uniref:Uncharacterized protein n=1 Tax=Imhoffiella purpurea TaxID=1249627 RepID=W9V6A7_9GAMM|nr:hypothetical protein D779_2105 [Imhoffiella purpurea]
MRPKRHRGWPRAWFRLRALLVFRAGRIPRRRGWKNCWVSRT